MTIDQRFDNIDNYLLDFRSEVIRRLDLIDQRLGFLSSVATNIDARLPEKGEFPNGRQAGLRCPE